MFEVNVKSVKMDSVAYYATFYTKGVGDLASLRDLSFEILI